MTQLLLQNGADIYANNGKIIGLIDKTNNLDLKKLVLGITE
jgi:hypothetical protein